MMLELKCKLTTSSCNTSTCTGKSIVAFIINDTKIYSFEYFWKNSRVDISQFKKYTNKFITVSTEKPDKGSCMVLKFYPSDYLRGNPQVDLYGKRGAYIGSCQEMAPFLYATFNHEDKPLTLYIIE